MMKVLGQDRELLDNWSWVTLHPIIERQCRAVSAAWGEIVPAEDLMSEIVAKLLDYDMRGRLPTELVRYGWRDDDVERQTKAWHAAAKAWAGGLCSNRRSELDRAEIAHRVGSATPDGPTARVELEQGLSWILTDRTDEGPRWAPIGRKAWEELTSGQQDILERMHRGQPFDKSNANKAIDRLATYMRHIECQSADEHEGPGSRRTMPNARAQAMTSKNY